MVRKNKSKGISLKPYLIAICIPLVIFSVYLGYRVYSTERILIPISVFALLAGLIFEYRRVSTNWSTIFGTALFSFVLSFFVFLPGKHYVLEEHIEIWPYSFLFIFVIMAVAFSEEKIIPKLTEGITLMQSIAVVYWVIDLGLLYPSYIFIKILMLTGLSLSLFTIYNAFSYQILSNSRRLVLSIWSSIIMVILATDNIYRVYQNGEIENTHEYIQAIYIFIQFFLLGISSIYIVQNYFMLIEFLPGKHRFFNKEYFKELKKLKQQHISRYSTTQITKLNSFLCVLVTGTIFGLNYHYKFLPRNFLIWSVFVLFPIGLNLVTNNAKDILPKTNDTFSKEGSR